MELLKKLIGAFGPSGHEEGIADAIINEIRDYADEFSRDSLGNIIAVKRGKGKGRIMFAANMDQLGVAAMDITKEGFLRCESIGRYKPSDYLYSIVVFENGVEGVLAAPNQKDGEVAKIEDMFIDIGAADREKAREIVPIGQVGIFRQNFIQKSNRIISGCLSNRIGCYILIETMKKLKGNEYDIYFVFTVQENTYRGGAAVAAYSIAPDAAIILNTVEAGDIPKASGNSIKLGEGAAIKVLDKTMICHPLVKSCLEETAKMHGIKYQHEIMKENTTGGTGVLISGPGVKTGGISIPVRYRYTAVETIDISDAEAAVNILSAFALEFKL